MGIVITQGQVRVATHKTLAFLPGLLILFSVGSTSATLQVKRCFSKSFMSVKLVLHEMQYVGSSPSATKPAEWLVSVAVFALVSVVDFSCDPSAGWLFGVLSFVSMATWWTISWCCRRRSPHGKHIPHFSHEKASSPEKKVIVAFVPRHTRSETCRHSSQKCLATTHQKSAVKLNFVAPG